MTESKQRYANIDIHKVLQERNEIAIVWSIEDVKGVRPDLNDEQAWEVLLECKDKHDSEWGFTYSFIQDIADEMFPEHGDRVEGEQP